MEFSMTKFRRRLPTCTGPDDFIVSKWFVGYIDGGGGEKPKTTIYINRKGSIVKER